MTQSRKIGSLSHASLSGNAQILGMLLENYYYVLIALPLILVATTSLCSSCRKRRKQGSCLPDAAPQQDLTNVIVHHANFDCQDGVLVQQPQQGVQPHHLSQHHGSTLANNIANGNGLTKLSSFMTPDEVDSRHAIHNDSSVGRKSITINRALPDLPSSNGTNGGLLLSNVPPTYAVINRRSLPGPSGRNSTPAIYAVVRRGSPHSPARPSLDLTSSSDSIDEEDRPVAGPSTRNNPSAIYAVVRRGSHCSPPRSSQNLSSSNESLVEQGRAIAGPSRNNPSAIYAVVQRGSLGSQPRPQEDLTSSNESIDEQDRAVSYNKISVREPLAKVLAERAAIDHHYQEVEEDERVSSFYEEIAGSTNSSEGPRHQQDHHNHNHHPHHSHHQEETPPHVYATADPGYEVVKYIEESESDPGYEVISKPPEPPLHNGQMMNGICRTESDLSTEPGYERVRYIRRSPSIDTDPTYATIPNKFEEGFSERL